MREARLSISELGVADFLHLRVCGDWPDRVVHILRLTYHLQTSNTLRP